jgi:hypothetical protein
MFFVSFVARGSGTWPIDGATVVGFLSGLRVDSTI